MVMSVVMGKGERAAAAGGERRGVGWWTYTYRMPRYAGEGGLYGAGERVGRGEGVEFAYIKEMEVCRQYAAYIM